MLVEPVHALQQLADRPHDRAELDADGSILAGGLDDDREVEVVREIEAASERFGEYRRVDSMKREDLLRDRLVLREHQAVRARAGVLPSQELQKGRDLEIRGVIVGERLAEIEHE